MTKRRNKLKRRDYFMTYPFYDPCRVHRIVKIPQATTQFLAYTANFNHDVGGGLKSEAVAP